MSIPTLPQEAAESCGGTATNLKLSRVVDRKSAVSNGNREARDSTLCYALSVCTPKILKSSTSLQNLTTENLSPWTH